jgi:hypothetical protein
MPPLLEARSSVSCVSLESVARPIWRVRKANPGHGLDKIEIGTFALSGRFLHRVKFRGLRAGQTKGIVPLRLTRLYCAG